MPNMMVLGFLTVGYTATLFQYLSRPLLLGCLVLPFGPWTQPQKLLTASPTGFQVVAEVVLALCAWVPCFWALGARRRCRCLQKRGLYRRPSAHTLSLQDKPYWSPLKASEMDSWSIHCFILNTRDCWNQFGRVLTLILLCTKRTFRDLGLCVWFGV